MGDIADKAESCATKTVNATVSSFFVGSILGAVKATWQDVPIVHRQQTLPALRNTAKVMGGQGAVLAGVGAAFAATECLAESLRGKKDYMNPFYGGMASGAVIGACLGSLGVAVGAGVAMGGAAAFMEVAGDLRGSGLFDDDATPARTYFPYNAKVE
mmetsp:Transcript_13415/g.18339  ORF Transcript_13415/g.18339 Transcript_13415/m.18339 type:complete len:157 (+) Transcript_13415:220-690(+)|eukprot:CAMPEP_0196592106 /NCGR_PEP_ID=MMETSP1081-20130531/71741_1 /TAXON_ID=36882 /ORGANISM="Pyramimonas amylifera, Strain CCMP720" /LENGTH=156 /DNA_ID=CAMNT_0041915685 /DNA_START=206 /DNA_END=676 /DNA_ORIENTATION=+